MADLDTIRSADVMTEKFSMNQLPGHLKETLVYLVHEYHDPDKEVMLEKLKEYFNGILREENKTSSVA